MKKISRFIWTMAFLLMILGPISSTASIQEKTYGEIAGKYILDLGERTLPFMIVYKDAKLYFDAQVPGQDPQPMLPVQGKDLTFTSIDPNGRETVFSFVRNDQKNIKGCTVSVPSRGVESWADKVEIK